MSDATAVYAPIRAQGILPLYFHPDAEISREILKSLYAGGARVVEYTNRGATAHANFRDLVQFAKHHMPDLLLGLGTVLDAATAETALEAGAAFIISPGIEESLIEKYKRGPFPWIPGCLTPSEIIRVYNLGIRMIKIFPGSVVGPDYVKAVKDLFPGMQFMPTGGVKAEKANLEQWIRAGVVAVGMGTPLISPELVSGKHYEELTRRVEETMSLWEMAMLVHNR